MRIDQRRWSIALALVVTLSSVRAQQQYTGPYLLGDTLRGEATFQYNIVKGDTVHHGPFLFTAARVDSTDAQRMHSVELRGHYDRGRRSGEWSLRSTDLQASSEASISGYELVRRTSGREFIVKGGFRNGKAQGDWIALGRTVVDSKAADTLHRVQCAFHEGTFTGNIQGSIDGIRFDGSFAEGGRPHGTWTFLHPPQELVSSAVERRVYQNGVLHDHFMERTGRTIRLDRIGRYSSVMTDGEQEDIPLAPAYFNYLAYTTALPRTPGMEGSTEEAMIDRTHDALVRALAVDGAQTGGDVWRSMFGSDAVQRPVMRVVRHPFATDEAKDIEELVRKFRECSTKVHEVLNDPLVDLGGYVYDEVGRYHAVFEAYMPRLMALAPSVEMLADDMAPFIDRDTWLSAKVPPITYPDSVTYTFKDRPLSLQHSFPDPIAGGQGSVAVLKHHMDQALRDIRSLKRALDDVLNKYRAETKVVEMEERLVRKRDSLLVLFSEGDVPDTWNAFHLELADYVSQLVVGEFKRYAVLDIAEKVDAIEGLGACFDDAIELHEQLKRLPIRLERIEQAYTRTLWNPYTFTFMEERVKERLYRAYEQVLLPHFWSGLKASIRCGEMAPAWDRYVRVYQRMLDLREQDTKDLERALRRETDPAVVMALISLGTD